jgi:hypothetical protein
VAEAILCTAERGILAVGSGLLAGITAIGNGVEATREALHYCLHSLAIFFNLLGKCGWRFPVGCGVDKEGAA